MGVIEKVVPRIEADDPTPEDLARIAVEHELKSFTYQNPKPQYLKGLVDFYKAVSAQRKGEAPVAGPQGGSQRIEVVLTDERDPEPEPGDDK
jgi:hypothetical protein